MKFKWILLLALGLTTFAYPQLKQRFPSNVRYIAGGYNNKAPYFSTLNGALNDVKALASVSNPYVFWIDGDTTKIADWDSVYNSGASMKDSIQIYYVNTGKIKWAGFGMGGGTGGSGGSSSITVPTEHTIYYNFVKWGIPQTPWQDSMSTNWRRGDSLLHALIVFTGPLLTIRNDSMFINITALVDTLNSLGSLSNGWYPKNTSGADDTTTVVRTNYLNTINALTTFTKGIAMSGADTYLQLPVGNSTLAARALYGSADSVFYDGTGGGTPKTLISVNGAKSLVVYATGSFSTTHRSTDVTVSGATTSYNWVATPIYSDSTATYNANDNLRCVPHAGGVYVIRAEGGTSGLAFSLVGRKPN